MPEPLNFVKQRNDCVKEARENKDWKRKIEIAEFEAKKARAILRKNDQMQVLQQAEFGNYQQWEEGSKICREVTKLKKR